MAEERIAAWHELRDITQPLDLSGLKLTRLPDYNNHRLFNALIKIKTKFKRTIKCPNLHYVI
jgi:hypothetical protein